MGGESLIAWVLVWGFLLVSLLAIALVTFARGVSLIRKAQSLAPLWHTVEELKAQIEAKAKELEVLAGQLSKARQDIVDGEKARKFLQEHAGEIAQKEERLAILKERIEETRRRFEEETEKLKKTQDDLNARTAELGKAEAALSSARNSHEALRQQTAELEGQRKALLAAVAELEAKRDRLAEEVAKLDALRHEVERLERERTRLEESITQLKSAQKAAKSELRDVETQVATKRGELNGILSDIEKLKPRPGDARLVWADLAKPAYKETKNRKAEKLQLSEEAWLRDFETLLDDHGFKFPERTLRAFHTGLKCGDATPLVVLAGISGTGKSLLPELYAAAAGMNFLSVPVQPHWDGPQDLLGFYNYMEGRYKATELARFLWQADWAHNKDSANAFSEKSLNIVLLDEMNLARVEYYFADFLSRLEQRRGLDLGKEANWDKASLELECGAGLDNQALLLDRNTFLIGTMNEDETTQMLSDKVIDRSNVLRFGRPANLTAKPKKDDFLAACEGRRRVTRSLWEAWREPQAGDTRYQETMRELNEALEQVGRPFAYRVQQAVDAYMAFYPVQTVEGRRQAFADQIEMKVLPKLNGLELAMPQFATTKTTISEIIKAYGDDELDEAFARACDPDNTFFKWRGVMRTE